MTKVISWNLKNISANKLTNNFQPLFQTYGMGNTVLDYIINVVMGADIWGGVISAVPADLFVVIELKTGGSAKGAAVSGNCIPTLVAIRDAMNAAVVPMGHDPLEFNFEYLVPLVTGQHETVGFIYNTRVFAPALVPVAVERDTVSNTFLPGRTPLVATLNLVANPAVSIRWSGIHDPPPSGGAAVRYRPPINYCQRLINTPSAVIQNTFFLGDFNCQPSDSYTNGNGVVVQPFTNLVNFGTDLPNDSLSSVKRRLVPANPGDTAYLNNAFDNIIYWVAPNFLLGPMDEEVIDLIGEAKDDTFDPPADLYPNRGRAIVNAYNTVSDHLPVIAEFNIA